MSDQTVAKQAEGKRFPGKGDFIGLAALVLLSAAGTVFYVRHEDTLYWSDYFQHFWVWQQSVELMQVSPLQWAFWLLGADAELSPYYTMANLPFGLLFGTSRLTFELSILFVYVLPFLLLSSAVVAKLFAERFPARLTFWASMAAIGLNPLFWAIPWRGYPDYAAGCLLMLGWLVYLSDPLMLKRRNLFFLGLLFGLTPLLRRHYAYMVGAAFVSMLVHRRTFLAKQQPLKQTLLDFAVVGMYAGGTAAILGANYLNDVIHFNYAEVFRAFHMSLAFCLRYYAISFGGGWLLMSALGWWLVIRQRMLSPGNGLLVGLYCLLMSLGWFTLVEMIGLHYTAHFAWMLSVGLAGLLCYLFSDTAHVRLARGALAAVLLFLSINTMQGLGVPLPGMPEVTRFEVYAQEFPGQPLGYLFSATNPPQVRSDLPEIASLCAYLSQNFPHSAHISVAASSSIFNDELLHHATMRFVPASQQESFPQLTKLPQIDYRDDNPVHNLAECDGFIVAEPAQYHLLAERQNLLAFTLESFSKQLGLARGFVELPRRFTLSDGVRLTVYKRSSAPTLEQIYQSVQALQPFEKRPHQMFNPWLVLKGTTDIDTLFLARARQHVPVIRLHPNIEQTKLELVYLGAVNRQVRLRMKLDGEADAVGQAESVNPSTGARTILSRLPFGKARCVDVELPACPGQLLVVTLQMSKHGQSEQAILETPAPE